MGRGQVQPDNPLFGKELLLPLPLLPLSLLLLPLPALNVITNYTV